MLDAKIPCDARDLRPEKVLLSDRMTPIVADLGGRGRLGGGWVPGHGWAVVMKTW